MSISPIPGSNAWAVHASVPVLERGSAGGQADLKNRAARECDTCSSRKYKDRSDDSTVSFQTPTHITPSAAPAAVISHEQEHVRSNRRMAAEKGKEVVFQTVAIHYAVCPECGRSYVAGGETRTMTRSAPDDDSRSHQNGRALNLFA